MHQLGRPSAQLNFTAIRLIDHEYEDWYTDTLSPGCSIRMQRMGRRETPVASPYHTRLHSAVRKDVKGSNVYEQAPGTATVLTPTSTRTGMHHFAKLQPLLEIRRQLVRICMSRIWEFRNISALAGPAHTYLL